MQVALTYADRKALTRIAAGRGTDPETVAAGVLAAWIATHDAEEDLPETIALVRSMGEPRTTLGVEIRAILPIDMQLAAASRGFRTSHLVAVLHREGLLFGERPGLATRQFRVRGKLVRHYCVRVHDVK